MEVAEVSGDNIDNSQQNISEFELYTNRKKKAFCSPGRLLFLLALKKLQRNKTKGRCIVNIDCS